MLIDHFWFTCSLVKDADLLGLLQLKWKPNNVLSCWPWMAFIVLRQSQHALQMHLWPPHTPPLSFLSPIVSIYIIFACNCNTQYIYFTLFPLSTDKFDIFQWCQSCVNNKNPWCIHLTSQFHQCFNLHFFLMLNDGLFHSVTFHR